MGDDDDCQSSSSRASCISSVLGGCVVWGTNYLPKVRYILEISVTNQFYFGLICEQWSNFAKWYRDEKTELGLI